MPPTTTDTPTLAARLDALDAARGALLGAVEGVTQEAFARRPGAGPDGGARWSVREVLWHVADSERCWRGWAEAALRGEAVTRFDGVRRPAELNRPAHLLDALEAQRAATLALLAGLDGGDGLDDARPSPGGGMSVLGMLGHLARHDREHAAQVAALRALPARAGGAP